MEILTESAFAKLNLTLDVLSRREDGYHDIRSVEQTISLRDDVVLNIGTGRKWALHCYQERVRDGAEDLRKEVDGAIVVHASRTTTKMSMAEKNAAKAQSDAYLQSLATKYSGKPAIQAPRSGVTFDAPKSKVKEERK